MAPVIKVTGRKPRVTTSDGHGYETKGKETPKLAQLGGKTMKEKEFNEGVQNYLAKELARCGIDHKDVAPGRTDISLAARAKASNDYKADYHLDIHANAFNGILDDKAGGIETYYYEGSEVSKKAAEIIHKHTMKGSKMKDRGVKKGAWLYMLKNTKAPAGLTELGFMDNEDDVKLLLSEAYRKECAIEIAKALCEIFGLEYVEEPKPKPVVKAPAKAPVKAPAKPVVKAPAKAPVKAPAAKDDILFRVIAGSYDDKANAEKQMAELKKKGFDSFIAVYNK